LSAPLDPGSVLLAGAAATVGGSLVLALMPTHAHAVTDVPLTIGQRLTEDRASGFAAGIVLHVGAGMTWAFLTVFAWGLTGWPITPATGAALAVPQWLVAEGTIDAISRGADLGDRHGFTPRRESLALFLSHLVYGAIMGATYRPGV
jgi:hypothetical protein